MLELLPDAAPAPSSTERKRARYSEKLPRECSMPGASGQPPQASCGGLRGVRVRGAARRGAVRRGAARRKGDARGCRARPRRGSAPRTTATRAPGTCCRRTTAAPPCRTQSRPRGAQTAEGRGGRGRRVVSRVVQTRPRAPTSPRPPAQRGARRTSNMPSDESAASCAMTTSFASPKSPKTAMRGSETMGVTVKFADHEAPASALTRYHARASAATPNLAKEKTAACSWPMLGKASDEETTEDVAPL